MRAWTTRRAAAHCGATGTVAALVCMLTCCLPPVLVALGIGASSAAGMAGMNHAGHADHDTLGALLHLLHRASPVLLIVSVVLIAGAFALRRPVAVIPALLAGVVLYVSVHAQPDPALMYLGMAVGYGTWIGLYLWTRPAKAPDAPAHCG